LLPRRRSGSSSKACEVSRKKQLAGDTVREATSDEVKELRAENRELKEVVAEVTLKNRVLKKSLTGHGEEDDT
jgi:transposase